MKDQAYKIGLKLKVEYTEMGKLSREFTAVLVELNTKHPVDVKDAEARVHDHHQRV